MKASELIKKLEAIIELYGDAKITYASGEEVGEAERVEPWSGAEMTSAEHPDVDSIHIS